MCRYWSNTRTINNPIWGLGNLMYNGKLTIGLKKA